MVDMNRGDRLLCVRLNDGGRNNGDSQSIAQPFDLYRPASRESLFIDRCAGSVVESTLTAPSFYYVGSFFYEQIILMKLIVN